ncbi:hypothetical protein [Flagellimonas allohymeniacidonis]|uniref:Uncharacterized protein n=1 Tax=Flagellimonas allohymeniacidonis TaxID=2517819 RepID=A0A4Q8QJT0_9FLAO|nr:hypothetical protein [Allomuricauda hymeniacidonis]TAI48496.1 hypothetical protein EW142_01440 [Allomuricauda hymeniacidonis]
MKKVISLAFMAFFGSAAMYAQGTVHAACEASVVGYTETRIPSNFFTFADLKSANAQGTTVQISDVLGSPYLADAFQKGALFYGEERVGTFYARYNGFNKEMEIKKTNSPDEVAKALVKDKNLKFVFDNQDVLKFVAFMDKKGNRYDEYLLTKSKGDKYQLMERPLVTYKEGKKAANSFMLDVPSKFVHRTELYALDLNTNIASQIPSKKSKLIDFFDDSEQIQIAALIKKKSLNIKDFNDLSQIFDFANTISRDIAFKE